jgi:hypothetical protein
MVQEVSFVEDTDGRVHLRKNNSGTKKRSEGVLKREGIRIFPQSDMNFAEFDSLMKLLDMEVKDSQDKNVRHVLVCGDGAPLDMICKARRTAMMMQTVHVTKESEEAVAAAEALENMQDSSSSIVDLQDDDDDEDVIANALGVAATPISESPSESSNSTSTLTDEQKQNLLSEVALIIGPWHCFQHALLRTLIAFRPEWLAFATLFRSTWGRINFFMSAGRIPECFVESVSVAFGILKWWLERYRKHSKSDGVELSSIGFDEFMDEHAKDKPVLMRLRALVDSTMLVKALYDSMRCGCYSWTRSMHALLMQASAGTGGSKYTRLLCDILIQEATIPDEKLWCLMECMFQDWGSFFAGADETTELMHKEFRKQTGELKGTQWFNALRRLTKRSSALPCFKSLGNKEAKSFKPPFGCFRPNQQILTKTFDMLSVAMANIDEGSFVDIDGNEHSTKSLVTIDGSTVQFHLIDPDRLNAAVLVADVSTHIFSRDPKVVFGKRPPLPKVTVTTQDKKELKMKKQLRDTARTSSEILNAFGHRRFWYVLYLSAYAAKAESSGIDPIDPGKKPTIIQMSSMIEKWRSTHLSLCNDVHEELQLEVDTDIPPNVLQHYNSMPKTYEINKSSRERIAHILLDLDCAAISSHRKRHWSSYCSIHERLMKQQHLSAELIDHDLAPSNKYKKPVTICDDINLNKQIPLDFSDKMKELSEICDVFDCHSRRHNTRSSQLKQLIETVNPLDRQLKIRHRHTASATSPNSSFWEDGDGVFPASALGVCLNDLENVKLGKKKAFATSPTLKKLRTKNGKSQTNKNSRSRKSNMFEKLSAPRIENKKARAISKIRLISGTSFMRFIDELPCKAARKAQTVKSRKKTKVSKVTQDEDENVLDEDVVESRMRSGVRVGKVRLRKQKPTGKNADISTPPPSLLEKRTIAGRAISKPSRLRDFSL